MFENSSHRQTAADIIKKDCQSLLNTDAVCQLTREGEVIVLTCESQEPLEEQLDILGERMCSMFSGVSSYDIKDNKLELTLITGNMQRAAQHLNVLLFDLCGFSSTAQQFMLEN